MKCPVCSGVTRVINSVAKSDAVYRTRECVVCGYRLTTKEYGTTNALDSKVLNDRWKKYSDKRRK